MSAVIERIARFVSHFEGSGVPIPRELRLAERVLARAPESVHPRLVAALLELHPRLTGVLWAHTTSYGGALCPAYPNVSIKIAARLALGEAPTEILRGLTSREAHDALRAGCEDPIIWIAGSHPVRSMPVARWLRACLSDPPRARALLGRRVERGPHGEDIAGMLIDRVDEILPVDLPSGADTGVIVAFESAAKRGYERWSAECERDQAPLAPAPAWWRPIRCARLLRSRADLVAEGRALGHCVASYARYVADRSSVIVSLRVATRQEVHRSTVELTAHASVRQHRGRGNRAPNALCQRALDVCLRRWRDPDAAR